MIEKLEELALGDFPHVVSAPKDMFKWHLVAEATRENMMHLIEEHNKLVAKINELIEAVDALAINLNHQGIIT